jgi:type I restriction enzyme, S subunit
MSPSDWQKVKLGDLGEVNRGKSKHRPRDASHLYGGIYPFIQTGDIKASGGFVRTHSQTYSEAGLAQSRLWPKDTMVITIAANIAETAILSYPACFPDSVVGFIANPKSANIRYIEYLFRFLRQQIQHENVGTGSVQDNINLQTLQRLDLVIPFLNEQKAIAAILGTLDDKIELNRRMNATLKAMAQALFKSWFVDFDPVRAKMEGNQPFGMDSETAALFPASFQDDGIPEGWKIFPLKEAASFSNSKRVPLSSRERAARKGSYRYFGATSVMDHVDDYLFDGVYVLVGEDGSVSTEQGLPFLQYVWGKFWVNNHAHILQGINGWSAEALYLLLAQSNVQHLVTGAVQPKLSMGNLGRLAFINPSRSILDKFCTMIAPHFLKRRALCDEISGLEKTRDYLLPKLISGDIRIPDVKNFVEAI